MEESPNDSERSVEVLLFKAFSLDLNRFPDFLRIIKLRKDYRRKKFGIILCNEKLIVIPTFFLHSTLTEFCSIAMPSKC